MIYFIALIELILIVLVQAIYNILNKSLSENRAYLRVLNDSKMIPDDIYKNKMKQYNQSLLKLVWNEVKRCHKKKKY